MTKTTELNWRLKELPTGKEIADLVAQKVISIEEARELLFTEKKKVILEDSAKLKALQDEVDFLRKTVDTLASKQTGGYQIVYHEWKKYVPNYQPWYNEYNRVLCQAPTGVSTQSLGLLSSNLGSITS